MDPISAGILTATLVPLVNGVAGEAGKQALDSLVAFVRRRFGRGSPAETAAEALTRNPAGPVDGEVLAGILQGEAARDEQVASWLTDWLRSAMPLVSQAQQSAVANVVAGPAQVQTLIQTHTISGSINIGAPTTTDRPE